MPSLHSVAMTIPDAADAGLRYADDTRPGITRRGAGTGFSYRMPDGSLASKAIRKRIEALVIPPAWADVWIAADPRGHLQATGRDARGRNNTVAVCRRYYVHPDVLGAYRAGGFAERMAGAGETPAGMRPAEAAVLEVLRAA